MTITRLYQLVKSKKITPITFNNFIQTNHINFESVKNYKNSWGENILMYAIKYSNNLNFLNFLYNNGLELGNNYYNMTPIDLCVAYNKNVTHQKLLILDWLYSKNILFNPNYLLIYPRKIINWVRNKEWVGLDVNHRNSMGNTALHEVCKLYHNRYPPNLYSNKFPLTNNSYDAFYVLLELGCDPFIKNNYNTTAVDYCIKNGLINNLNILYYFHYKLDKNQLDLILSTKNYYKLINFTLWILENYNQLELNKSKTELENDLLTKIITIQYNATSYNTDLKILLEELSDKIFFDELYKIKMFKVEENIFF